MAAPDMSWAPIGWAPIARHRSSIRSSVHMITRTSIWSEAAPSRPWALPIQRSRFQRWRSGLRTTLSRISRRCDFPSIGTCEVAFLLDVPERRIVRGPGRGLVLRQPAETIEDPDAIASQTCSHRVAIGKMFANRVEPDGAARKEAAGAGGIGIVQHALEFVARRAARKQHPGDAPRRADLANRIELALRGLRSRAAVTRRQRIGRQRTFELQQIDAVLRF